MCRDLQSHPSEQTNSLSFMSFLLLLWGEACLHQRSKCEVKIKIHTGSSIAARWLQRASAEPSCVSHTDCFVCTCYLVQRALFYRKTLSDFTPTLLLLLFPSHVFLLFFLRLSSPLLLLSSVILSFILGSIYSVRPNHLCPSTKAFCRFDSVCEAVRMTTTVSDADFHL